MPFVQRIVNPTYLSRSHRNASTGCGSNFICNNNHCYRKSNNGLSGRLIGASAQPATSTTACQKIQTETTTKAIVHTLSSSASTPLECEILLRNLSSSSCVNITPKISKANTQTEIGGTFIRENDCDHHFNVGNHDNPAFTSRNAPRIAEQYEDEDVDGITTQKLQLQLQHHEALLSPSSSPSKSGYETATTTNAGLHQFTNNNTRNHKKCSSSTSSKILTGYEFDSICNITLSNALRQLGSLVIIANDIFLDLNKELLEVGNRSKFIKGKIVALEKKVCNFDPKTVTVPVSDLLTFAQCKVHYQCDKPFQKELFTSETRPTSVKVLYEEAGKSSSSTHSRFPAFIKGTDGINVVDNSDSGSGDELVCTPVFGKANRKMRTRIDAEIEIRLPAAIEELRKWTSSEALGDVTVTPDCMNRVETSISTSVTIGDNGVLTPALSPSVLSADADALCSINIINDSTQIPNDVPLNHRLPSPEEQCKIIALRYPAEVISVDTSGKRFERMCLSRKSTTGCVMNITDANNLNDDVQTVSRRSRSRKIRGKRRNTIAGIDQKEIQDAAVGDSRTSRNNVTNSDDTPVSKRSDDGKFARSKSSDVLKKELVALPYDKGKSNLTRLNSLKQWGRNRFKFMTRNECNANTATMAESDNKISVPSAVLNSSNTSVIADTSLSTTSMQSGDIDDECVVHDLISQKSEFFEKEGRFSHERKPSYSSSEKSVILAAKPLKSNTMLACGNVKLRDTSSLNRQRRSGINGQNKDEPHSSSGNWSASSESGRTSIGSEITIQPKSSASNTSLNVSSFHPGSGPPSSLISRRRFFNTSASSSVTSEGTATPDLQVNDAYNDNDETSSAYSCDTEGYYTSFHMDSGLRTLKEEEPLSPMQNSSIHPSNYSFGRSLSNQTVLTAENEYELYGRGSTSTTTSSAGTVCTTLLVGDHGPDVPERISSLSKLNKSNTNSESTSTLERSYSSSTIGSTLERTGTIKRNALAANVTKDVIDVVATSGRNLSAFESPECDDNEFEFKNDIATRSDLPLPSTPPAARIAAEIEWSESSDLEGIERIERIKQKTAITARRIPSMCIITPTTSDDENIKDPPFFTTNEYPYSQAAATATAAAGMQIKVNDLTGYAAIEINDADTTTVVQQMQNKDYNLNHLKRIMQYPLNHMLEKFKVVLPNVKKSPAKSCTDVQEESSYETAGEYITIADISNNNSNQHRTGIKSSGSLGIYYSNDIVYRNLDTELPGNLNPETEYISLNELPGNIQRSNVSDLIHPFAVQEQNEVSPSSPKCSAKIDMVCAESASPPVNIVYSMHTNGTNTITGNEYTNTSTTSSPQKPITTGAASKGARVKLNSQGKIIYDSDSLKRRKGAYTTFAPGPYVKETESVLLSTVAISPEITQYQQPTTAFSPISGKFQNEQLKENLSQSSPSALLLTNGGISANPKVNVRPVVPQRVPVIINMTTKCLDSRNTAQFKYSVPIENNRKAEIGSYLLTAASSSVPSPSSKSTSSSASISSSSSSAAAASSSSSTSLSLASSKSKPAILDKGYQRFVKPEEAEQDPELQMQVQAPPAPLPPSSSVGFNRTGPLYWTLHRRQPKHSPLTTTSMDDLYATPVSRLNRTLRTTSDMQLQQRNANISPIVPRTRSIFLASTPTKPYLQIDTVDSKVPSNNIPAMQPNTRSAANWDDINPERLNTCSDRIGTSKTSLMDFKKLLLAKSAKNSPVQKKLSAVEILKKNSSSGVVGVVGGALGDAVGSTTAPAQLSSLNSNMKLLDLSGSPKSFANRRMLRQGHFGSPSKSFAPKQKSPAWHMNTMRTDVISTTILEANSEEDHSSSSGGSKPCSEAGDVHYERNISDEKLDLKNNIFLQTEENNFMKGELKSPFVRKNLFASKYNSSFTNSFKPPVDSPNGSSSSQVKYNISGDNLINTSFAANMIDTNILATTPTPNARVTTTKKEATNFPAFETAL